MAKNITSKKKEQKVKVIVIKKFQCANCLENYKTEEEAENCFD